MDRRKFIGGLATNLIVLPLSAKAERVAKTKATRPPVVPSVLAALDANTACNLGPYASAEFAAKQITDFSSITYDAVGKRMCLFGGGHGPSQETDIRVFDLTTLQWSNQYSPTSRGEMTLINGDSDNGRWISTNQPYARHSYNMTLVAGRRFYMMTPMGMPDHLDAPGPPWGGRLCWYDFDAGTWTYSRYSLAATPWYIAAAAVLDPVSNKIIIAGPNNQAGSGALWVYDPATDSIMEGPRLDVGHSHDIVYFPPNDRFYVMQNDGRVWELTFDRSHVNASTIVSVSVTGSPPAASSTCGFAYDSTNQIIGGNVINGIFHAFDPLRKAWSATATKTQSGSSGVPNQVFHCLEFDSGSGCFIFLSDPPAATTWAYRYVAKSPRVVTAGVSDLVVTLDFGNGNVATFAGSTALDKGDFVGEFVRQKCYMATNASFPDWRVFFRVDADNKGSRIAAPAVGWRDEIVVEYGRTTHGKPINITNAYTATIRKGGAPVASYIVNRHWWGARWRYQSAVRPVVRDGAALKSRGWIPNFGLDGLFGLQPYTQTIAWNGPMSAPSDPYTGAFSTVMGGAGDNPQIGYLTEYGADYVINGGSASLANIRTEGEWFGNIAMHFRDDTTGAILSVRTSNLNYVSNGGTINDNPVAPPLGTEPAFVYPEAAHMYPCANAGWVVTEDPFYLEELQFVCNWQLLWDYYHRTVESLPGLVTPGETRAFAWGLRDMFLAAATTPASVPSWLLPRSYFKACLDDNKTFSMKYVSSRARIHSLFKTWTRSDSNAAWMSSWLNAVVGMSVSMGFADWTPIFAWGVDLHIKMTNGASGWNKQWPVPYYCFPNKAGNLSTPALYFSDTTPDATTCASWTEFWNYYASGSNGKSDTSGHVIDTANWDGQTLMAQFYQSGPSYFLHLRSVLAVAATHGVAGARECYDYIQAQLTSSVMPHYRARGQARFSIDPVKI